jgi:hypothetical protein
MLTLHLRAEILNPDTSWVHQKLHFEKTLDIIMDICTEINSEFDQENLICAP